MPLYLYRCECGSAGETIVPLRDYRPEGLPCPECGALAKRLVTGAAIDGPTDTRPLVIEQIGKTFTTKRQLDAYLRDNPDVVMRSGSDSTFRAFTDRAREKCERSAKKLGYRDLDHRRQSERREMGRRRDLERR